MKRSYISYGLALGSISLALASTLTLAGDDTNGATVGNGGIDGVYEVRQTTLPNKPELLEFFRKSQLPASIKDPLYNEIFNSPYLIADRDVVATGERFAGDWIILGDSVKYYYARTMPRYGATTTFFPKFYQASLDKQIEMTLHEAIHRIEFFSPNNVSEDFVVAAVKQLMDDVKFVESGDSVAKERSKLILTAWFDSVSHKGNVPIEKIHWVGQINIYWNKSFTRPYGNQLISFSKMQGSDSWYSESSFFTSALSTNPLDHPEYPLFGIERHKQPTGSFTDFMNTLQFRVKFDDFYLVGSTQSLLSPIEGLIFESNTHLYAGQFKLMPYHDSGTGVGYHGLAGPCKTHEEDCYNPSPLFRR